MDSSRHMPEGKAKGREWRGGGGPGGERSGQHRWPRSRSQPCKALEGEHRGQRAPSEACVGPAGPPYPALPGFASVPTPAAGSGGSGFLSTTEATGLLPALPGSASAPQGSIRSPGFLPSSLLESCPGHVLRENVLRNLADKAFEQPICEALLDQRFFNGIGNYLRAEILHRLGIPPFEKARTVLETLRQRRPSPEQTLSQKIRAKLQSPDLLELCHSVPKEVVQLGGKGYGPESGEEDFAAFRAWLRCYGVPGMSSLRDGRGRTIWFQEESPARRNPRERSRGRSTGRRTLSFQAWPVPGHVGHGEALLSKVQPSSRRGPASSRTQKCPRPP
ncbi:endonuclease 8-like 1 isoform X4 [Vulpes vulpes]|uniref:Endonuclease 8-like 1 isoform X4 n=1 Tax=Vulpes vulpes TaxID=9627 RepID=A0ABM4ZHZ0_VULVU